MDDALKHLSTQFLAGRHSLMSFIVGLVRDPHVAEDLFQEVWIQLVERIQAGGEIRDPHKWFRAVARNLILVQWRAIKGRKVLVDSRLVDLAEQAFSENEASDDEWVGRHHALAACVKALSKHSRRLLELRYFQDRSGFDVARRSKKSYESTLMALSRIRGALKRCIERRLHLAEERS